MEDSLLSSVINAVKGLPGQFEEQILPKIGAIKSAVQQLPGQLEEQVMPHLSAFNTPSPQDTSPAHYVSALNPTSLIPRLMTGTAGMLADSTTPVFRGVRGLAQDFQNVKEGGGATPYIPTSPTDKALYGNQPIMPYSTKGMDLSQSLGLDPDSIFGKVVGSLAGAGMYMQDMATPIIAGQMMSGILESFNPQWKVAPSGAPIPETPTPAAETPATNPAFDASGALNPQLVDGRLVDVGNKMRDILGNQFKGMDTALQDSLGDVKFHSLTDLDNAIVNHLQNSGIYDLLSDAQKKELGGYIYDSTIGMAKNLDMPEEHLYPAAMQGHMNLGAEIGGEENSLAQEARKYKSAEEFVKAQTPIYHGTENKFDLFDVSKRGANEQGQSAKNAFWFSDSKTTAGSYGENLKEVYANFDNPITIDAKGKMYGDMRDIIDETILNAKKNGNDGVIIKNLSDRKDWGNYESATHYGVLDVSKLKTKSQLTDFYNQATQSQSLKGSMNLRELGGKQIEELRNTLAPASASPEAQAAADQISQAKAEIANANSLFELKNKGVNEFFNKIPDEENIANISNYNRTGQFANEPVSGYSEQYKQLTDSSHKILQDFYGNDRVGYVENYVRRQFVFGNAGDEKAGIDYLTNKMNSLSASTSPLKSRVLDMPLDEALADMRSRGIDVKPLTTNPQASLEWTVANARQASVYGEVWNQAKESGMLPFVKAGSRAPQGLVPLDDRVAKVMFPSEQGMVVGGQYYADPNVARIFNNAISKGREGSNIYQMLRTTNNALNQLQLAWPGFHTFNTAVTASVTDLALGVQKISRGIGEGDIGTVGEGFKFVGKGLVPGVSFIQHMNQGNDIIQGLIEGNPEMEQFVREQLNPAGGRLMLDQRYRTDMWQGMVKAMNNNNYVEVVGRAPLAAVQQVSSPLMNNAIPAVKLGGFFDVAAEALQRLPADASPAVVQRTLRVAWDSMDNRFGQLTYDNLFWNNTFKDLSQLAVRSVGWSVGTIKEPLGAMKDILTMTGSPDRAIFSAIYPLYVGLLGAIYMYLHTGKGPQSPTDYFAPENGLPTKQGNPDRSILPSYMKDVRGYSTNPVQTIENKASPLLEWGHELLSNKNYYGDMIRNPEDPIATQLQQVGADALKRLVPFSFTSVARTQKEGGGLEHGAEGLLGINPAPSYMTKTPEQLNLESIRNKVKGPNAPRTPEQQDALQVKFNMQDQASQEVTKLKGMNKADALTYWNSIADKNPDLAKEITKQYDNQSRGINSADKVLKSLPVENRAQYIFGKLNEMKTPDEKTQYYQNLIDKSIITNKVDLRLRQLLTK